MSCTLKIKVEMKVFKITHIIRCIQGADFKNNQTSKQSKQFYLDQQEASKVLFLPSYWPKQICLIVQLFDCFLNQLPGEKRIRKKINHKNKIKHKNLVCFRFAVTKNKKVTKIEITVEGLVLEKKSKYSCILFFYLLCYNLFVHVYSLWYRVQILRGWGIFN